MNFPVWQQIQENFVARVKDLTLKDKAMTEGYRTVPHYIIEISKVNASERFSGCQRFQSRSFHQLSSIRVLAILLIPLRQIPGQ